MAHFGFLWPVLPTLAHYPQKGTMTHFGFLWPVLLTLQIPLPTAPLAMASLLEPWPPNRPSVYSASLHYLPSAGRTGRAGPVRQRVLKHIYIYVYMKNFQLGGA